MPMSPDDYASWVKTSTASFPQAALELSPADANGFYQCTDGLPRGLALATLAGHPAE